MENAWLRQSPLWRARNRLRASFFRFVRHVADIDDSRDILSELLEQQNAKSTLPAMQALDFEQAPYAEVGTNVPQGMQVQRSDAIFVTGRFRSGSTLVWNLFRNMPGVTSYYEPFNERRWFDVGARGAKVDPTHLGVAEYWAEYRDLEVLGQYYREDWIRRQLYMPATAWNPAMQRYIELLMERAPGRPVLQFNRVDLRLPWLRARFPQAKILHIYRNPRDQWCSTLPLLKADMPSLTIGEFQAHDGFYLLEWARDLRHCFPFLTLQPQAHPYELFYQVWKLSYAFGHAYADSSLAYESLVSNPEATIRDLLAKFNVARADVASLASLVAAIPLGKWKRHADQEWFAAIERRVDEEFRRYFSHTARVLPADSTGSAFTARRRVV